MGAHNDPADEAASGGVIALKAKAGRAPAAILPGAAEDHGSP
jgi:hypothetical protein